MSCSITANVLSSFYTSTISSFWTTLQRRFKLCVPRNQTGRPCSQFPYSYICERFIYSQDRSPILLQPNRQTDRGNILIKYINRYINVKIGTEAAKFPFWEFFFLQFSVHYLCSAVRTALCGGVLWTKGAKPGINPDKINWTNHGLYPGHYLNANDGQLCLYCTYSLCNCRLLL